MQMNDVKGKMSVQTADTIRKIKIPNACIGLGLRFTSPYEMLRRERARFVLGPGREVA